MRYRLGSAKVSQEVSLHTGLANGVLKLGLQYSFKVSDVNERVIFVLNPEQVLAESSAGNWSHDKSSLTLSPEEAKQFTITLLPKN